jgi:SAM-dependent methyltransferase
MEETRRTWEQRYREWPQYAKPSSFLARHADLIGGRVLDVAGGNGRNGLFLAAQGARVDIIDIAHAGLRQALDAARQAAWPINAIQADLETYPLPADVNDVVNVIPYLQPSQLPTQPPALRPGGLLLFETFLIDQRQISHPRNPEFLLQHGELRDAFADFEVLEYREGLLDSDPPAYLAQLAARRPRNGIEFSNGV